MHREGISTPRARHKGQQPLIECAKNVTSLLFIFPFYIFYFFGVDNGTALAPTYPQVR